MIPLTCVVSLETDSNLLACSKNAGLYQLDATWYKRESRAATVQRGEKKMEMRDLKGEARRGC